jgi:3-methyl-2-oxobutanoate hydroxymethyltransferase
MDPHQTRVRIPHLLAKKQSGQKITMLAAYDATMARLLDRAEIDALLVGDSLGTVILGYDTTLPVTLDVMIHHTRAVSNGAKRALVIADMPFLTYQVTVSETVRNAGRLIQEGGAAAVKLEGGAAVADTVRRLVEIGIPVMGHVGLTPQSVHRLGGYRAVGKTPREASEIIEDARALERAGAFAVVLESIPDAVAAAITAELKIPTIGIGAGPACDGQVLVSYDAFGLFDVFVPRFVKQYARLGEAMVDAAKEYIADVQQGKFPGSEHSVSMEPMKKEQPLRNEQTVRDEQSGKKAAG